MLRTPRRAGNCHLAVKTGCVRSRSSLDVEIFHTSAGFRMTRHTLLTSVLLAIVAIPCHAADDSPANSTQPLIGFTALQTNLPGGRHANVRTMRAAVVKPDGSGHRLLAAQLADSPDAWTQFAGWSPDGKTAIVYRGWQDPANAAWEEEHKRFRMEPGRWLLDSHLFDLAAGTTMNVTAVERVSDYNSGLFYLPDGRTLGFTALINGVSKPWLMDLDGRHKRDVSGKGAGFAYGYTASPDGSRISYHEDYQIHLANTDGTGKQRIETGHPFNFGPTWSADGAWLLFLSGRHYHSNPHVVRRDGTGLRKLVDLNGYRSSVQFLDVPDFHEGSSDVPVWSAGGTIVFHTAKVDPGGDQVTVELFQTSLDGITTQLTKSAPGTLHYHPQPSPDGRWLAYGSKRNGVRQLFVMRLDDRTETRITNLTAGYAAMWPHWQRASSAALAK